MVLLILAPPPPLLEIIKDKYLLVHPSQVLSVWNPCHLHVKTIMINIVIIIVILIMIIVSFTNTCLPCISFLHRRFSTGLSKCSAT